VNEETPVKTVLVIEDEHQVRTLLALMLEQGGYRVLEAAHPNEAATIWRRDGQTVDAILADVWLPGISGPELVSFFRRECPGVRSLFISGMNPEIRPDFRKLTRNSEILSKPFTKEQLLAAMARTFEP
jgi:CheY-like chemotaxis protein